MATLSECIRIHLDDPGDKWLADMIRRRATELAGGSRVSAAAASRAVGDVIGDFEREIAEVEEQLRELLMSPPPKKVEKAAPAAGEKEPAAPAEEETVEFEVRPFGSERTETIRVPKNPKPKSVGRPEKGGYGANNKLVSVERAEELKAKLRAKLNQLNVGMDPEMIAIGTELAVFHIEAGARSFAAFSKQMVEDLGEKIKPFLRSFYEGARYYPGVDTSGMTAAGEIDETAADEAPGPVDKTAEATDNQGKDHQEPEEVRDEVRGEGESGDRGRTGAQGADDQEQGAGGLHQGAGQGPARGDGGSDSGGRPAEGGRGDREPGTADTRPVLDYRITADDHLGEGGPKAKFKDNLAAIRVLKRLGDDGIATAEDQKILVKYVGWGGLSQAFHKPDGTAARGWEAEAAELKELLTAEEYAAARRSTQDAHYTSRQVVDGIYAGLARLGFTGGRALEPSVGTGNFIGLMPGDIKGASRVTAVELDPTTAAIARHLYPLQRVVNSGFEAVTLAENSYDLAVGNPPFGDKTLFDPANKDLRRFSIHNFFFAKSIKALRPDGLLAMVVSSHLMDKLAPAEREWMAARCELLGAVRLPSTAFAANAGTEVTTDILFLRKRREEEKPTTGPSWTGIRRVKGEGGITYRVNEYFAEHPEQMLGELGHNKLNPKSAEEIIKDGFYDAAPGLLAKPGGPPLEVQLMGALMNLPQNVYRAGQTLEEVQRAEILVSEPGFTQPYGFALSDDGQAVRRLGDINGEMQWEPVLYGDKPLEGKRLERFKTMLKVRDAVRRLMRAELADDPKMENYRAALNRAYDQFVADYGYFSDNANKLVFGSDSTDYPLLRSLERDYDKGLSKTLAKKEGEKPRPPSAKKASIFTKRLRQPYREVSRADTPADALAVVLRENGRIDLARICALCGQDEDAVLDALGKDELIFKDPADGQWRTREAYLSGNVKRKLAEARAAGMARNAAALEKVQPEDVTPAQIRVNMGAAWMPQEIYNQFAREELGASMDIAHHEAVGRWTVITRSYDSAGRFSTPGMSGAKIYERLLQGKDIAVYDTDSDGKRVLNPKRTEEAKAAAREMEQHFAMWLLADTERAEAMAKAFNEKMNTHVEAAWDGSHMIFPGMGTINPDVPRDDQLNPHQKNAVWRFIQQGGGLLDHVVGAGKTFAAIAAGIEMRRMGLAKKPMYVVPNRLVDQWAADFQLLYPGANVLVIGKKDFEKKRRQEFMGRIATGDWDAVVLAHSSFGFIQAPLDYERRFVQQQIDDMQAAIEEMRQAAGKKDRTVKEAERARDKLRERLKALNSANRDQVVDFADLGVDALFVDEAHEFKNLFYITNHSRVAGLGDKTGSQKAFNLFLKARYLQEAQAGRGVFFLTGTPVSNTIAEMYTMMRYMAYDQLVVAGMRHFDQWANNFAAITSDWEVDPSGTRYRLQARFREFINLPGMMGIYKSFADVITQQNLIDQAEKAGKVWPVPKIKNGRPENVVSARSEDQASYMRWVVWRMDHMPDDPREDNPLKATGEAMKASLDMRLIDPSLPDHPGSKVNAAVKRILDTYQKWNERRGTQLVFCDLSVPKKQAARHRTRVLALRQQMADLLRAMDEETDSERLMEMEQQYEKVANAYEKLTPAEIMAADQGAFSVYDDIREKLVAGGMKPSEVAFIHDANTESQVRDLFEKVNRGEVRVLIGSTSKMGAGMNVQKRLVALHHLDAPWRPSDLEQREGRIVRRGNLFFEESLEAGGPRFEVEVLRYATKESLDTRRWQIIEGKARVVEQLRAGGHQWGESIEDAGGEASNAAEMKAETSGNPLILEEVSLRKRIGDLEARWRNHENQRLQAEAAKRRHEKAEAELDADLKAIEELVAGVTEDASNDPARWEITVDGERIAAQGVVAVPAKLTEADVAGIADEAERKKALADNKAEIKAAEAHNKKALAEAKKRWAEKIAGVVAAEVKKPAGTEVLYRGVEFFLRGSISWKVVAVQVNDAAAGYFAGVDEFHINPADFSPDGLLVRLKNRIDKIAAGEKQAQAHVKRWAERYRQKYEALKPFLEKKFEEQQALETARARHTEVLAEVRQVDQNAPPPDADIERWAGVRSVVQAPRRDKKFYIYVQDEDFEGFRTPEELGYKNVKEVTAAEIGAPETMTFFVHQKPLATRNAPRWVVSEARSGVSVATGTTRQEAIQTAKEKIERHGVMGLDEAVAEQVNNHGESPWATGEAPAPGPLARRTKRREEASATLADVRAVFKGQDAGQDDDGSVWVKTAGGAKVTIRTVRRVDAGSVGVQASVGEAGEEALGRYFEREIQLQRDAAGRITLRHEAEHFMERAGLLRPAEIAALRRHIQALAKKGKWTPEDPADIGGMEDRAEWVARHVNERETMHGQLRKLLDRVWDFVNHLWNLAARTLGLESLTSTAGVVADIQSGDLFGRPALARDQLVEGEPAYQRQAARWYSQLTNVAASKLPNSGSGPQMAALLETWAKKGEIKAEELEWSGLADWLRAHPNRITRDQVVKWLEGNNLRLVEVEKGERRDAEPQIDRDRAIEDLIEAEASGGRAARRNIEEAAGRPFDEIRDYTDGQLMEALMAEDIDFTERATEEGAARYSQWQIPGGENYRELLITIPTKKTERGRLTKKEETRLNELLENTNKTQEEQTEQRVLLAKDNADFNEGKNTAKEKPYQSSHWDEPNVLAHVRFNERTGPNGERILFIEEVQSDWHQEGRKGGYRGPGKVTDAKMTLGEALAKMGRTLDHYRQYVDGAVSEKTPAWLISIDGTPHSLTTDPLGRGMQRDRAARDFKIIVQDQVPDAPWKKTWPTKIMQRMVRYAAENGFDSIAWTPGEVQAGRYDLSKQVDSIIWFEDTKQLKAYKGEKLEPIIDEHNVSKENLEKYVGKDVAEKLAEKPGIALKGNDLKVGGEGMKAFYDRMLPNEVNKFFGKKAWGNARVGTTRILTNRGQKMDLPNDRGQSLFGELNIPDKFEKVWHLPITPEMKHRSLTEGMPLFTFGGPRAQGARVDRLAEAQRMQADGADRADIWQKTGWWELTPGSGEWKFEIPDAAFNLRLKASRDALQRGQKVPLADLLDHPALQRAYPQLKDMQVRYKDDGDPNWLAAVAKGSNLIRVNPANIKNGRQLRRALAHEIQHLVQDKEGFASGGTPEALEPAKGYGESERLYAKAEDFSQRALDEQDPERRMELNRKAAGYVRLADKTARAYAYATLPGEAEARLVQARLEMSDAERRRVPPWESLERMLRKEKLLEDGQRPEDILKDERRTGQNGQAPESRLAPPALFRRQRQAAAEIEADTLTFMEKLKAALRPAQLTEGRPDDLNYVRDLILRTPSFFAEKLHGTKQIYRAAQRKRDDAEALSNYMERHDDINAVKLWDTLSAEDRQGANAYLVKSDEEASGYRIRLSRDGRHWQVMSQEGQVVAHYTARPDPDDPYNDLGEIEAAAKRRDLEKQALREAGMSEAQIAVIMAWRLSTDKGFDLLVRDMRRAEAMAKRTGAPAPMVTIEEDGKPVRISMKEAMARMGELRGHYFPRIRKRGRFVLKATQSGQASRREHFTTGQLMNVRAEALRRQGWTVTTETATEVGEDVFSLDGGLVKTQQMVNAALEAVEKRMKSAAPLEGDALAEELRSVQEIFASALGEQIAAVVRARGARGHMIRRSEELWKGYEEDAQVALAKYIRGLAGAEAKRRMVVRMMRALTGTEISREDFEAAAKFNGDYDAFMADESLELEAPEAMTEEAFAAINDPVGWADNETALDDLESLLKDTDEEAERKKIGENIAEKKRWVAERYEKYVRAMGIDQRRQPKAFKWAKAFIGENTRNPELADRVIGTIRGLAVGKYLAFRVFSAPLVNLTALPTSVIATLKGAGIPYADTWRHLAVALGDYLTYRQGKKFDDAEKQRVFDHIRRNGWDNAQFNSEAMATLRGAMGRTWDKTIEYGMLTFSESERANRAATIAAAYYGLRAQHPDISFEALMERARKVSDDAHGVYNKGNYPFLALGRHPAAHVARMFNVFKVFAHTYLQNMVRLGFTEKDYGALAHMVLAPAVLAGLGSSAMMPVIHAVARAFGADEPEEELYDKIGAVFGMTAEELARHGLVGQLGFTIKGSLAVGVGDLPTNIKDLIGAPGSVVTDLYKALGYAGRGDALKAIEAAAPTGVGNIAKAVREYSQGITSASNRPVFYGKEQLRPTLAEAFWRGFGFNPTRIATARERQWKEYRVEQQYDQRRGDIYARFRSYVADGRRDPETLAEIMGEVARFNEDSARWNLAPITVKRLESAAVAKPDRRERARDEDAGRWRLADPDTEAGWLIEDLERTGHLEIREPSRAVVYRHRRYDMPEAAYDTYRQQSAEIARRKIERALWRLKALTPERQAEEIGKIVSAARRQARQVARRAALMAGPVDGPNYGKRTDGTAKGSGFLGELKRPDGGVSTELSVGVGIDGQETEIPLLVPTLTRQEVSHLLAGNKPTKQIMDKAVAHAVERTRLGLSPFAGPGEQTKPK